MKRLESALAARDKYTAEGLLVELGELLPNDPRIADYRRRVRALPGADRFVTITVGGSVTLELVLVPPGKFVMGSNRTDSEKPLRTVQIAKSFYLGKYEVTQQQWETLMGSNPSYFKGPKNPVDQVTWDECQLFVAKLNEKDNRFTFRLPSEAEWEYACRAGSTNDFCHGNSESALLEYAWFIANETGTSQPVGRKKPNAWGFYDMHGNVWEWCQDIYHPSYDNAPADGSARLDGATTNRVLRGGSWYSTAFAVRSANRGRAPPTFRGVVYGFRVAATPKN
ncbi:MAG: formylglycine-generating enzyme family protein [Verrucomicrobiae bacterium]|nr:formylglycine-generating enzyme family protein [Verrucomicrobiae bacterium]